MKSKNVFCHVKNQPMEERLLRERTQLRIRDQKRCRLETYAFRIVDLQP